MKVAIRTDFCGNNIARVVEYATKLKIRDIWAFPQISECYDEREYIDLVRLQEYQKQFTERDLNLRLLTEVISEDAVISSGNAKTKAQSLSQTIEVMGELGIDLLFLFLDIPFPEDKDRYEERWKYLIEIYEEIVPSGEKAKVRIANHGHQFRRFLIWNYTDMDRLLKAVPSDYNGITFCTGCYQLSGEDIYNGIYRYQKKIFFVHIRDVIRKPSSFDEVLFGRGEVDVMRVLKVLYEIGYDGLVCPEHLPRINYEPYEEINTAWGIGYLVSSLSILGERLKGLR